LRRLYKNWFSLAQKKGLFTDSGRLEYNLQRHQDLFYPSSVQCVDGVSVCLIRKGEVRALAVFNQDSLGFSGHAFHSGKNWVWLCPLNHGNAVHLRRRVTSAAPATLRDRAITFGVGDRLGIATPGHIRILRRFYLSPVLAQQSPRELELSGRTFRDIIDPVTWAVFQEGYTEPWGADGDHLKTVEWVKEAQSLGCTMITADLSDHIHTAYGKLRDDALYGEYRQLEPAYRKGIEEEYLGHNIRLDTGEHIAFTRETLARVSLVYHRAIVHAQTLYRTGTASGEDPDFEVSIDETDTSTSPEVHLFVARELQKLGVRFVSLAPRFSGTFEKAIDYEGDIDTFKRTLRTHSAIARHFGHKLSIHSGSDKFSIYPLIGELTDAHFHIKTCGTSWLEALSVIATVDPPLFRDLYKYAKQSLPLAARYYQTVASPESIRDIGLVVDRGLPDLLKRRDERQVLHITYGQILNNEKLKGRLYRVLNRNLEYYWGLLEEHLGKHLRLLGVRERRDT
jgi:hypothetical protein